MNNLSPMDNKLIYNNTNGNINKEKNMHIRHKFKFNNASKNYTNREIEKIKKLNGNKKIKIIIFFKWFK